MAGFAEKIVSVKVGTDANRLIVDVYNEKAHRQYEPSTPKWSVLERVMADESFDKVVAGIDGIGTLFADYGVEVKGNIIDVKVMAQYLNIDTFFKSTVDCYNFYKQHIAEMGKFKDAFEQDVLLNTIMLQVRKTGVRIDTSALAKLTAQVEEKYYDVITRLLDFDITPDVIKSPKQLGIALNVLGIHSEVRTMTGAESWDANALLRLTRYPVIRMIGEFKNYDGLLTKFLRGAIKNGIKQDGRIHCVFNPVGAVTGRFSCDSPNLQNIPARDKSFGQSFGKEVRSLFIPEEDCYFGAADYSQIEYLLLCNYALGNQAKWLVEQARSGVDFHEVAMQLTGITSREMVKPFNYGAIYGMGWRTALKNNYALFSKKAEELNISAEQYTVQLYNLYHEKFPVIKTTMAGIEFVAGKNGYLKTIGGRYVYLPKEEFNPASGKKERPMYKMLNYLLQGSAADILKKAICEAYKKGCFNELVLHLTVHDELDFSIPKTKEGVEATKELTRTMEGVYKDVLKVPMKVECDVGCNWGYWKDDVWEAILAFGINKEM